MTDLAVWFIGNKRFVVYKELLKTRFQDTSNMIKLVINKKISILMFRD